MTTMKGPTTGLPYLINAYPVQEIHGPSMKSMYQCSLDWIPQVRRREVVVVSDAYYLDDASRTWLRDSEFLYFAAINPTRFREVWQPPKIESKENGTSGYCLELKYEMRLPSTCGHMRTEKCFILTNAFSYKKCNKNLKPTTISTYLQILL
jgi:hypothetical protein